MVFASNSYTMGSAAIDVLCESGMWMAKERYFLRARQFENHHGGMVRVGDYLFGVPSVSFDTPEVELNGVDRQRREDTRQQ